MARIGFIGTGEIAAAMVRGLAGQGHEIAVSSRNEATAARLVAEVDGVQVDPNDQVVARSDIVVLCLLAEAAERVLPGLPFRPDHAVISVMVDMPLARLSRLCAPATDIVLTIPLPPIAQGGCPLPVCSASSALDALFGHRNPVIPVRDERALNAHLAITALCSPILDQMLAAADWLADLTGDPAGAEAYVTSMIRCYLPERPASGDLAGALRKLSTEGGLNASLRASMAPAKDALCAGLDGFRSRLGLPDRAENDAPQAPQDDSPRQD